MIFGETATFLQPIPLPIALSLSHHTEPSIVCDYERLWIPFVYKNPIGEFVFSDRKVRLSEAFETLLALHMETVSACSLLTRLDRIKYTAPRYRANVMVTTDVLAEQLVADGFLCVVPFPQKKFISSVYQNGEIYPIKMQEKGESGVPSNHWIGKWANSSSAAATDRSSSQRTWTLAVLFVSWSTP